MTDATATAEAVVEIAQSKTNKAHSCLFSGANKVKEGVRILREGKIPQYDSPESAVATIKVMADYIRWRQDRSGS